MIIPLFYSLVNILFYVIMIPCWYQVIVLVCNVLVFYFYKSVYVSLQNAYFSNL